VKDNLTIAAAGVTGRMGMPRYLRGALDPLAGEGLAPFRDAPWGRRCVA